MKGLVLFYIVIAAFLPGCSTPPKASVSHDGLVKTKETADHTFSYTYDENSKKVKSVVRFDKKTKKTRTTIYFYDKKGNLIRAKSSDGQEVRIKYNERGLISELADRKKRKSDIKYNAEGKPI